MRALNIISVLFAYSPSLAEIGNMEILESAGIAETRKYGELINMNKLESEDPLTFEVTELFRDFLNDINAIGLKYNLQNNNRGPIAEKMGRLTMVNFAILLDFLYGPASVVSAIEICSLVSKKQIVEGKVEGAEFKES